VADPIEDQRPESPGDAPVPPLVHKDPYDADWRERLTVLGSVGGVILLGLIAGFIVAHDATLELIGLVPVSFFAAGKFLPMWGISGQSNFSPWELGLVIWAMDTCTVLIMVYGLEAFYRFRRLKGFLDRVQSNAGLVLAAYPRMRRAAVIGVVLFVLFPVAGTGALVGSFLGILLGLRRQVLIAAVSVAGFAGGMLMAFAAIYFRGLVVDLRAMQQDPAVKYIIIGAIAAVVLLGFWLLNRAYRRALEQAQAEMAARVPGE
jgi:uncharacterized membrane protein